MTEQKTQQAGVRPELRVSDWVAIRATVPPPVATRRL